MDISSEMIHALLPLYLVLSLSASALTVGIIEGVAEATALITKLFSGALSDWLGKRKFLAALGYGLAACTKPIFALASSIEWLMAARFVDRIGKGIRGAPRDALVADLSPSDVRGASSGLRQSLDTVGAFIGPLLAIGLMWLTLNNFTLVFWVAVFPAFLSFLLIVVAVKEPKRQPGLRQIRNPISRAELSALGAPYWWTVAIAAVFTLARFSEAFLILKAQSVGLSVWLVPSVLVIMNIAYALAAYPVGILSDQGDRRTLLILGFAVLVAADIALAITDSIWGAALGVAVVGIAYGPDAGPPRDSCGRRLARRASWYRVRLFQSREQDRCFACQRCCRFPVGCFRRSRHVLGGSGLYRNWSDRAFPRSQPIADQRASFEPRSSCKQENLS
jgi:MFS family permease